MKRVLPQDIYRGLPCSVVAVGCACQIADSSRLEALQSPLLHSDGYLSLRGMETLLKANLSVIRSVTFKRGERPVLRDWAHEYLGVRAVICLEGHYIYYDGRDYHSFFWNGGDHIVKVWYLA